MRTCLPTTGRRSSSLSARVGPTFGTNSTTTRVPVGTRLLENLEIEFLHHFRVCWATSISSGRLVRLASPIKNCAT